MKKLSIKLGAFLLAAVMALAITFPSVLAENETIDTSKEGSLTITKTNSINTGTAENPVYSKIGGAQYTLYKIAKIEQKTDNGVVTTIYTPLYDAGTVSHLPASITAIDEVNSKNFNDDAITELDNLTGLSNSSSSRDELTKYTAYYADGSGTGTGTGSSTATETVDGIGTAQFGINTTYTLESGYVYLAVESKTPDGAFQSNNFLVTVPMYDSDSGEWEYDIQAEPKNDLASVVKSVKTSTGTTETQNDDETVETVKAGDIVQYQLVVTLPKNFAGANYTNYSIVDTPGDGLILLDNSNDYPVVVTYYAGTDITGNGTLLYSTASGSSPAGYEYSFNAYKNQMSFELIDADEDSASYAPYYDGYSTNDVSTLVITYYAKIAATSSGDGKINNSINLNINENTYEPGGGSVDVYSYDYRLWKTDDKNIDKNAYTGLPDAQFILSTSEGANYLMLVTYEVDIEDPDAAGSFKTVTMTEWITSSANAEAVAALNGTKENLDIGGETRKVTYTTVFATDSNGLAKVEDLSYGRYYLTEVKAPSYTTTGGDSYDFTLLTSPVEITISSSSNTNANTTIESSGVTSDNWTNQIVNKLTSSWQLPGTGDMGIMFFIIVGAVLAITAILLIKRTSKKDGEGNKA